jgi:CRP/FNR family transcriptional activator FtrB
LIHPRIALLEKVSLFQGLPGPLVQKIAEISGLQRFNAQGYLFRAGEQPDFVYAILEGSVVVLGHDDGRESVIEFLGPGETILIPFALLATPYLVSARATTDGQTLMVPARQFRQMVKDDTTLASACAYSLSRQWHGLITQIREIKTHSAIERVAQFLVAQSGKREGSVSLVLPGMKKEVATRLGIKPETFSRSLKKLREHGVETRGDTISISSLEHLASLSSSH